MADDAFSLRSSLSIATIDADDDTEIETVPLRTRILNVVKSSPNLTIRPARVSQELGLSINDASAELCGLLKVVGKGSTFTFEDVDGVKAMVFTFPPDFESKAMAQQRKDDWITVLEKAAQVAIKVIKILTAFGLVISTVIVSIAGMVALVAALVALSRGGDRNASHQVSRQLRNLFLTLRQLLWCYAMFGSTGDDQDPLFRDAAYDSWLVLSLCCGNPSSMWFWMRASHLRRRRRRFARGWGNSPNTNFIDTASDLEGVSLIRRGSWGNEESIPVPSANHGGEDHHRGLLSIAVEFLFGPTTPSLPSETDKWRLRSAVIVEKSSLNNNSPISLQELSPYVDAPPASLDDTARLVSEGLLVVAHFNGVPSKKSTSDQKDISKTLFGFPELISESQVNVRYDDPNGQNEDETKLEGLFYAKEATTTSPRSSGRSTIPNYLYEQRKVFTKLAAKQFYHCLLIAVLNFIGVVWFAQSLEPGGILENVLRGFGAALKWSLIPVLRFYSKLFFFIPGVRLAYILGWNELCKRRNQRRAQLAAALKAEGTT